MSNVPTFRVPTRLGEVAFAKKYAAVIKRITDLGFTYIRTLAVTNGAVFGGVDIKEVLPLRRVAL